MSKRLVAVELYKRESDEPRSTTVDVVLPTALVREVPCRSGDARGRRRAADGAVRSQAQREGREGEKERGSEQR